MKDATHLWMSDTASYNCPLKAHDCFKEKCLSPCYGAVDKVKWPSWSCDIQGFEDVMISSLKRFLLICRRESVFCG